MDKTINKKRAQEDKKRKQHEQFLKRQNNEKKYKEFRQTILKLKETENEKKKKRKEKEREIEEEEEEIKKEAIKKKELTDNNNLNNYSNNNFNNTKENESRQLHLSNFVKEDPFLKCLSFIEKKSNALDISKYMHPYLLYCNFDICLKNNMTKHVNLAVNIKHSYYKDVIIFVNGDTHIWKDIVFREKMKMIKKIVNYEKFEETSYTDGSMKQYASKYDLFLFDSSIRTRRYNSFITIIKKNNKAYTTIPIKEDTFIETLNNAMMKSYVDINKGTSNSIPIGYLSTGFTNLYENMKEVESFMVERCYRKNVVINSIYLKFVDIAIPLYVSSYQNSINCTYGGNSQQKDNKQISENK